MNLKIILSIILILNLIFINGQENKVVETTISEEHHNLLKSLSVAPSLNISVSSSNGYDSTYCGIGVTAQPCLTLSGVFSSFKSYCSAYGGTYQLIVSLSSGTYYGSTTPINLAGMNVIFNSMQGNAYYGVTFANSYHYGPIFTINSVNGFSSQPTSIVLNGISFSSFASVMSSSYDNAYFLSIHPAGLFSNYTVQLNNNNIPYGQGTPFIALIDTYNVFGGSGLANDWDGYRGVDYTSMGVYGININFYQSTFGYQYFSTNNAPYVLSQYVPIGLGFKNCTFNRISSTSMVVLGRSRLVMDNILMTNISTSREPVFTLINSEVEIKNSQFLQGTTYGTAFLVALGCFVELNNITATINYGLGSWDKDYPVFDIERSSATILNSNIQFTGLNNQNYDQGAIYALNSDISLRLTTIYSNISYAIYSDGSNIFGFGNTFNYNSYYGTLGCSNNHASVFRGDENLMYQYEFSNNCQYYDQYQKTVSAFMYIFVGIAFVLVLIVCFAILRSCFKCICQRRSCKKNSHIYSPVCDENNTSSIGLCTTTVAVQPTTTTTNTADAIII